MGRCCMACQQMFNRPTANSVAATRPAHGPAVGWVGFGPGLRLPSISQRESSSGVSPASSFPAIPSRGRRIQTSSRSSSARAIASSITGFRATTLRSRQLRVLAAADRIREFARTTSSMCSSRAMTIMTQEPANAARPRSAAGGWPFHQRWRGLEEAPAARGGHRPQAPRSRVRRDDGGRSARLAGGMVGARRRDRDRADERRWRS